MATSNKWLTPYQRSYNSIKAKLIAELKAKVPEITDFSEGNIFVILLSLFAAVAEVIHYYIDNMAREAFLPTARRYTSLYNHAKLVDYHIKCAVPATVDVIIYNETPVDTDISIPVNTRFLSEDGKPWVSTKEVVLLKGTQSVKVPLIQKEPVGDNKITLGQITSQDVSISLGTLPSDKKYVEGSMNLMIDGQPWVLVDTFAYSTPQDRVYKVEPDEALNPRILFGDGQFGMKPDLNGLVEATYYLTYGSLGNLEAGAFTQVPQVILDKQDSLKISANGSANGGSDYESFDMLKDHIPLSIKTLGVAITKDDYEAITKLVPGVNKAYINYRCGKYVEVYITPDNPSNNEELGWGQASGALIADVEKRLSKAKVITTNIAVGSTHAARIYLEAEVTGKKSFNKSDIHDQVISALLGAYNYNTSDINKPVRLSDLYSLIDNQSLVDFLQIKKLYLLPYPRPLNENQPELVITDFNQVSFTPTTNQEYEKLNIKFTSGTNFTIRSSQGKEFTGTLGTNIGIETGISKFTITIGETGGLTYNTGDTYELYIQKMNSDLVPQNYNIPIFSTNSIQLTIHEVV